MFYCQTQAEMGLYFVSNWIVIVHIFFSFLFCFHFSATPRKNNWNFWYIAVYHRNIYEKSPKVISFITIGYRDDIQYRFNACLNDPSQFPFISLHSSLNVQSIINLCAFYFHLVYFYWRKKKIPWQFRTESTNVSMVTGDTSLRAIWKVMILWKFLRQREILCHPLMFSKK